MSFFPLVPPSTSRAIPTYVTNTGTETRASNVYTFSSVSLGTATSDRYIIVGYGHAQGGGPLAGATINGVAATIAVQATNGSNYNVGLVIAAVPTGTTGDIVLTFTNTPTDAHTGIVVWSAVGLSSATPASTGTDTTATSNAFSASLTIPIDGFGIGFAFEGDNAARTFTWANMTEDADPGSIEGGDGGMSGASFTTASTATRTATASGSVDGALVLASWR